jgi:hypothetical protein
MTRLLLDADCWAARLPMRCAKQEELRLADRRLRKRARRGAEFLERGIGDADELHFTHALPIRFGVWALINEEGGLRCRLIAGCYAFIVSSKAFGQQQARFPATYWQRERRPVWAWARIDSWRWETFWSAASRTWANNATKSRRDFRPRDIGQSRSVKIFRLGSRIKTSAFSSAG